VAYADLGGLGSKQGAPVAYYWVMPSLMPQFLPWLAILALLLLKPNRCASAWWVLIPLGMVAAVACAPQSVRELLPSSQFEMFLEWIGALGFGLAAVWLVSSYLGWKHRMLAFLGILVAQGVFSSLAYVVRQGWEGLGSETFALGVVLLLSALVISAALSLAGLMCRGRYGGLRLSMWLLAALVVAWLVVIVPFSIIAMIASGGNFPALQFLISVPVAAGIIFGVLLPFLVLAFANGFYRERLQALLHLGGTLPPPVIASPVSTATAAVESSTVI
jgi:hypothetical protein